MLMRGVRCPGGRGHPELHRRCSSTKSYIVNRQIGVADSKYVVLDDGFSYNFWMSRAIRFKFGTGTNVEDGPSCVWTIKRPLSGRGLGHMIQFPNFGTPFEQSASKLIQRWTSNPSSIRDKKTIPKLAWPGSCGPISIFGTLITFEWKELTLEIWFRHTGRTLTITITIITIKNLYSACSQRVSKALRRRVYINIEQKKYVLRQRLNLSTDNVGSLRYSGRLFHTIGPDAVKAVKERRPYVDSLTGGTTRF